MTCPICHSAVRTLAVGGPVWYAVAKCDCTEGEGFGEIGEARTVALKMWCWRIRCVVR